MTDTQTTSRECPVVRTPRLLLMVNGGAGLPGIGEIFLEALVSRYPSDRLVRFSTTPRTSPVDRSNWLGVPVVYAQTPASIWPVLSSLRDWQFRRFCGTLVDQVARLAERHRVEAIWAVLNSTGLMYLAHQVSKVLGLPLLTTVWDPPEHFYMGMRLDPWTRALVWEHFQATLAHSSSVTVMSEQMYMDYRRITKIDPIRLIHGIPPESLYCSSRPADSNEYVIGFAGSLYAKREWNALLDGIDQLGGTLAGKPITVRFVGRPPRFGARRHARVDYRGPCDLSETIRLLSEVDVCYLPYWMDRRHQEVTRLSFPSKLSTYIAANRPVLFHVPRGSSPDLFLRDYPIGFPCHSLDPKEVASTLARFANESHAVDRMAQERRRAVEQELGHDVMLRRFASFIDVGCRSTK